MTVRKVADDSCGAVTVVVPGFRLHRRLMIMPDHQLTYLPDTNIKTCVELGTALHPN